MSTAHIITARNVNDALREGLHWLAVSGVRMESRVGPVLKAPGPVITEYQRPWERVLFSPVRDANPFFHLYECIWMLAGRNDSASVANYAKHMGSFAENGVMNGAYGHRWRHHFGYDQLLFIIEELKRDPMSRRAVLTMWDAGHADNLYSAEGDPQKAAAGSKDVPCNTHVYFDLTGGTLEMTVCNRSNDVVWGCYGANAVHMSFLQEFMAAALGVPMGVYYQVSNNFHAYIEREDVVRLVYPRDPVAEGDPSVTGYNVAYQSEDKYQDDRASPMHLELGWPGFGAKQFLAECEAAAEDPTGEKYAFGEPFFNEVFTPMMRVHALYKAGDLGEALEAAGSVLATDWGTAAAEWIHRRIEKRATTEGGQ